MRLVEIEINCFDRKVAEVVGDDAYDSDVKSKCVIDLDRVSSVWLDPKGDICIHLGSHNESYWTSSFTLPGFVALWKGAATGQVDGPATPPAVIGHHNKPMPSASQMPHLVQLSINVVESPQDCAVGAKSTLRSVEGAISECVDYVEKSLRSNLFEGGACSVVCGTKCGTSA